MREAGFVMTIALVAHDAKKELMVQFCIAYRSILASHQLIATGTTGRLVSEATGLETGPDGTELLRYVYLSPADGEAVIRTGTLTLAEQDGLTRVISCETESVEG